MFPDRGLGAASALGGGDVGDVGAVVVVGQGLTHKGFTLEEPPPPFHGVQPDSTDGSEGGLEARVSRPPVPNGGTCVAGQVVDDGVECALG